MAKNSRNSDTDDTMSSVESRRPVKADLVQLLQEAL